MALYIASRLLIIAGVGFGLFVAAAIYVKHNGRGAFLMQLIDLKGRTYGRLKVLRRALTDTGETRSRTHWVCQCECGNLCVSSAKNMTRGLTKSCGCLDAEEARENIKAAHAAHRFLLALLWPSLPTARRHDE